MGRIGVHSGGIHIVGNGGLWRRGGRARKNGAAQRLNGGRQSRTWFVGRVRRRAVRLHQFQRLGVPRRVALFMGLWRLLRRVVMLREMRRRLWVLMRRRRRLLLIGRRRLPLEDSELVLSLLYVLHHLQNQQQGGGEARSY